MFFTPHNRQRSAALLGGLILAVSACGSTASQQDGSSASGEVASLSEGSAAPAASSGTETDGSEVDDSAEAPTNPDDAFELFEQCMADAGIGLQTVGGDGDGAITVDAGDVSESADPQSGNGGIGNSNPDAFNDANKACSKHLEGVDNEFDLSPEQEVAFEEADREFRACMKEAGIEVPEIGDGDGGLIVGEVPTDVDPQSGDASFDNSDFDFERFEAAAEKCNSVYEKLDAEVEAGN